MSYRKEILGLRAIAVSFVLLFHFFPAFAPNGFIGVDLFFTISGYVITSQIYRQMIDGGFSFRAFFLRRIKRILPLVFTMVTASMMVGYFILLPSDFERLSVSAVAVSTFWSNIFFWRDGGYFGSTDKLKPLLHMWSLSVEEQFYIVFPLLFWLFVKLSRGARYPVLLGVTAMTAASFIIYAALNSIGGAAPAFFLSPSRMWQFGLGAFVAILLANGKLPASAPLPTIAISAVLLTGVLALPGNMENVVIAAAGALYIATASGVSKIDMLMSSSLMRYLGTRSFSLYVWHWPIVAYLSYILVDGIAIEFMFLGLFACFALSEISFRWIEEPFRGAYPTRASVGLICGSVAVGASLFLLSSIRPAAGLMDALAGQAQTNFRCEITDFEPYGASRACLLGDPGLPRDIALLGNSYAQMYAEAIVSRADIKGSSVILVPLNGCLPSPTVNISTDCMNQASVNLREILDDRSIHTVIIGTTYPETDVVDQDGSVPTEDIPIRLKEALLVLVNSIQAQKKRVLLIGPIEIPGYNLPSELGRKLRFGLISDSEAIARLSVSRKQFDERFGSMVQMLSERLGPDFLRPDLFLCDTKFCHFGDELGSFFADPLHLGRHGIATITPLFEGL
jgi:peptidoglycan/LPS O-acetylase OafA/YrhL